MALSPLRNVPAATRTTPVTSPRPPAAPNPPGAPLEESSFEAQAPASLPIPPGLALVPRPAPEVEVPGVGVLTAEQAQTLVAGARAAQRELTHYAQLTGSSVAPEALTKIGEHGALKALARLGYQAPRDLEQLRAQVGPLLSWALAPFELKAG